MQAKALDKKRLWRDIEREERRKAKLRLAKLRADLRTAKAERRDRVRGAVERCRTERAEARERAKALRLRGLAEIRAAARAEREAARTSCGAGKHTARTSADRQLANLTAEARALLDAWALEREGRAAGRAGRATARELRSESDDEVRQNIPPDLVVLFDRVRRGIKGSARMSRTEAFLQYAEEHPEETIAGLEEKTDAIVREMQRIQRSARR